jgi:polyphosphate kinase
MTSDKKITNEVYKAFSFFNVNYRKDNFYHLVLSPFFLRNRMTLLIDNEIKNAKAGKKAYIWLKINNITDADIINHLYEASNAGVTVRLIVRGMFSLVTGVKNLSENIKAIGIVDRFLEHTRFMIFCNGGNDECYISSADLMTRNIDHRIEVTCPVFDRNIKNELKHIFEIQWNDNVKARKLDPSLSNRFVKTGKEPLRSQIEVYRYIRKANLCQPEK